MADQRIKGQEVSVLLIVDGVIQSTTADVRSFEVAAKTELLEEGYLGEKTDRYDEIFKGIRGRLEFHFENTDVFKVIKNIIDRAKRRTPGTQINIKSTLQFPNGTKERVVIQNAFFGELPINFPSRSDYGTFGMEFSAEDVSFL